METLPGWQALEAGCMECVEKPLDFPKLVMIVSRYGPRS
jgi:hypothetical protein